MKNKSLSNEQLHKLMNVYDFEVSAALIDNESTRDFHYLDHLLFNCEFISINHILYFEWMLDNFAIFPEFKGIFDQLYYGIEDEMWIAPETVDFSEYALDPDIELEEIPKEIRVQLRPITREDVLKIAKKIEEALNTLHHNFFNNVYDWLEEDGVDWEDLERQYKLESFEEAVYGAFYTYFNDFPRFIVPADWSLLEYLLCCWGDEDPENYSILQKNYDKRVDELNKTEEKHNHAFLEWEDTFRKRVRFNDDDLIKQEFELMLNIEKERLNYLRNHVFNCVSEETLTDFFNKQA